MNYQPTFFRNTPLAMTIQFLIRGFMVGLIASISLGPVGVMCIQRTLSKNRLSGLLSGLGAATADTLYAIVAFFFIALVGAFIEENMNIIAIIGGAVVAFVGVRIYMTNPEVQIRRNRGRKTDLWQDYISTFLLTFTNPAFVLWLMVLFTAFNLQYNPAEPDTPTRVASGVMMIAGFFGGAASWWYSLTWCIDHLRRRFRPHHLIWINRITGVFIALLGAWAIVSTLIKIIDLT